MWLTRMAVQKEKKPDKRTGMAATPMTTRDDKNISVSDGKGKKK